MAKAAKLSSTAGDQEAIFMQSRGVEYLQLETPCEDECPRGLDEGLPRQALRRNQIKREDDAMSIRVVIERVVDELEQMGLLDTELNGSLEISRRLAMRIDDMIAHVWMVDDVMERAEELRYQLTPGDAKGILHRLEESLDSQFGITWTTIDEGIRLYGPCELHEVTRDLILRVLRKDGPMDSAIRKLSDEQMAAVMDELGTEATIVEVLSALERIPGNATRQP